MLQEDGDGDWMWHGSQNAFTPDSPGWFLTAFDGSPADETAWWQLNEDGYDLEPEDIGSLLGLFDLANPGCPVRDDAAPGLARTSLLWGWTRDADDTSQCLCEVPGALPLQARALGCRLRRHNRTERSITAEVSRRA